MSDGKDLRLFSGCAYGGGLEHHSIATQLYASSWRQSAATGLSESSHVPRSILQIVCLPRIARRLLLLPLVSLPAYPCVMEMERIWTGLVDNPVTGGIGNMITEAGVGVVVRALLVRG